MADKKKFLDLNGLGYAIRKMDNKKADLESPAFTGTPTINNKPIITNGMNDDNILIQSAGKDANLSLVSTNANVSIFGGQQVLVDSVGNIALHTSGQGMATYNGSKIMTEANMDTKLNEELDTRLDEMLGDKIEEQITTTIGDKLDEKADIESPVFTGTPTTPAPAKGDKSLQIANTKWVDDNYIGKQGDATVNGSLTVIGNKYPLLTLKSSSPTSSGYLMNIQGNLMFGDCSSNSASRQYYGRMVPALNKAIVGAVSIGYNPKDNATYQKSTDYGLKFDIDVAGTASATPSIQHQSGSFFVGVNGAYIGYSGSVSQPLNYDTQIYQILDSHNIATNEYIASLEQRIAALEAKLAALDSTEATEPEGE